jgi:hypothetical protein
VPVACAEALERRRAASWRAVLLGASVALLDACYSYVPLKVPEPQPGMRITAQLTDSATASLGAYVGRNAASVSGRVVGVNGDDLTMSVTSVQTRDGQVSYWKGENVSLPRSFVAGIRERRLAKGSTVLMGGLVAGGLFVLIDALAGGLFGSEAGGPPPPPQ